MNPIAIIDCAIKSPSYPCMNKLVEKFNFNCTYHWVSNHGLESLNKISKPAGYIIFGSHSNIHERLSWQIELANKMKNELEKNIPILAICFGHQLMADAYGAKIELTTNLDIGHQGVRSQEILEDIYGFNKGTNLINFISHKYEVKQVPKDFIHLSTSKDCLYEGLAHRSLPLISFQGHPEASEDFISSNIDTALSTKQRAEAIQGGDYIIKKFLELTINLNN